MFSQKPSIPAFIVTIAIFLLLDVLAVALRFLTRRKLRLRCQLDDWLTIPSLLGAIGLSSIIFFRIEKFERGYRWQTIDAHGRIFDTSQYVCTLAVSLLTNNRLRPS
jgi:hypothetical protein